MLKQLKHLIYKKKSLSNRYFINIGKSTACIHQSIYHFLKLVILGTYSLIDIKLFTGSCKSFLCKVFWRLGLRKALPLIRDLDLSSICFWLTAYVFFSLLFFISRLFGANDLNRLTFLSN